MYTDDDLERAVRSNIFDADAVERFRQQVAANQSTVLVDEENLRLVSGFNDIFVVIASALLLASVLAVFGSEQRLSGILVAVVLSWGLAEFFVRIRKMALPAIVLMLAFVGGSGMLVNRALDNLADSHLVWASVAALLASALHWWRFRVPITIAAGVAALLGILLGVLLAVVPGAIDWIVLPVFLGGLLTFSIAMAWDISDRQRITRRADVAFWLHLLSAPLIVHPLFLLLVLSGDEALGRAILALLVYSGMVLISLLIDRRAFMVSSLAYVLYALARLFDEQGGLDENLAITGVVLGSALLLLSGFWHRARTALLGWMPESLQRRLPVKA
jgi:hypothetical protein